MELAFRIPLRAHSVMIEEHVPLAPYTTFRLGGPGRFFARVSTLNALQEALAFAQQKKLKVFYLGGGSNVLVPDAGFDGLVVKIEFAALERTERGYVAAAGELWDTLVARAVADGLWGLENLSGIPGTVGGAVVQNIGAYGAALSQTLAWVEAFDTQNNKVVTIDTAGCAFGYRDSIFKQQKGRYVVLRAAVTLSPEPQPNVSYADLAARFATAEPSLAAIREAVLAIRADKFPNLALEGTAGSFFLNPTVPAAQAHELAARYRGMPLFAMPETAAVKVPLGWILDKVLNLRGYSRGGARLYERQALVIAASQSATAHDVRALCEAVKKEVEAKTNLKIKEEVTML